jgi:hydrogenase maturation protease
MPKLLIAGLGNIFLGDDGFGVEVAQRLQQLDLPAWVTVADFGIRGVHLAFEMLESDYETVIFLDATPRGGAPGTVYLIEPEMAAAGALAGAVGSSAAVVDGHGMTPDTVLALLGSMGGQARRVLVVGCEPESVAEGIGLSPAVSASIWEAVSLVLNTIEKMEP